MSALGTFYGYASGPHYGWILRHWAFYTCTGAVLLALTIATGPKWAQRTAIFLLIVSILAGLDPARRLFEIGWSAP